MTEQVFLLLPLLPILYSLHGLIRLNPFLVANGETQGDGLILLKIRIIVASFLLYKDTCVINW